MIFQKKLQRSCQYCIHGTSISQDQILCKKDGVVSISYACRKFKYDPCKRVPVKPKALDFKKYSDEDFTL